MNAFTKNFDYENFHIKLKELKPDYIIMGKEAGRAFRDWMSFYTVPILNRIDEGYCGHYQGIPVFICDKIPEDKIVFGLE